MTEEAEFEFWNSKTYAVLTGCGNLYVTVCRAEDKSIFKVIIHRKGKDTDCSLTMFDALQRQATFGSRRELLQVIKDLRGIDDQKMGHRCHKFNITVKGKMKSGGLGAYSCADAVSRVLERSVKSE